MLTPANAAARRRWSSTRRGDRLRQGRHRPAPPAEPPIRPIRSPARMRRRADASPAHSSSVGAHVLAGVWASSGSAGPKLAAGTPWAQKGPRRSSPLGPGRRAGGRHQGGQHRVVEGRAVRPGRRRPAPSGHPRSRWGASSSRTVDSASATVAVGGEAVVEHDGGLVGHDVAGHPTLDGHRLELLGVLAAVEHRAAALVPRPRPSAAGPRRWTALRPAWGRAVWARAPARRIRTRRVPWQPASTDPAGRLAEDGGVGREEVRALGPQLVQAVVLAGPPPRPRRSTR